MNYHTINRLRHFALLADGFEVRGKRFHDADVEHVLVGPKSLPGQSGRGIELVAAQMVLTMRSGEKIWLEEWEGFSMYYAHFGGSEEKRKKVLSIGATLMGRTYQTRLAFYLDQVERQGYFLYDECKFYPHDKVVFRETEFPLSRSTFAISGDYIEIRPVPFTKPKVKWWQQGGLKYIPHFSISYDPDIILGLLKQSGFRL